MTIDLTARMAAYALPLPAISQGYNHFAVRDAAPRAVDFTPRQLDFLTDQHRPFFRYGHALYSADFARKDGSNMTMVSQRSRAETTIFMDSGGFGFINGAIPLHDIDDLRREALAAQERHADVAVIVDVPTACIGKGVQGASTFQQCLEHTLASIDYALHYRKAGSSLRLLNMVQGAANSECRRWYNAIADAPLDGFGFAGARCKDVSLLLELMVAMIRDGRINGQSWFHIFGTNHPGVAIYLTALQRELRGLLGDGVRISFDSSTSFRYVQAHGLIVTGLHSDRNKIRLTNYRIAAEAHGIRGGDPWPFDSPIGRDRRIGDFLSMTDASGGDRQKPMDVTGAMMLTNHCLYSELTALIRANRLFDMEHGDDWINRDTLAIPYLVHRGVDRIAEVFQRVKSGDYNGAIQHAKAGKVSLSMFESSPDNEDNIGR
jgi:hypothetical protein